MSATVHVSNELDACRVLITSAELAGIMGGLLMLVAQRPWARLYTRSAEVRDGMGRTIKAMAVLELVNFPLNVCGGIVRGTTRPTVGIYVVMARFYPVALPVGMVLGFRVGLGIEGLLAGFIVGTAASLAVLIACMDWMTEVDKVRMRAGAADKANSGKEASENGAEV